MAFAQEALVKMDTGMDMDTVISRMKKTHEERRKLQKYRHNKMIAVVKHLSNKGAIFLSINFKVPFLTVNNL